MAAALLLVALVTASPANATEEPVPPEEVPTGLADTIAQYEPSGLQWGEYVGPCAEAPDESGGDLCTWVMTLEDDRAEVRFGITQSGAFEDATFVRDGDEWIPEGTEEPGPPETGNAGLATASQSGTPVMPVALGSVAAVVTLSIGAFVFTSRHGRRSG